MYKVDLTFFKKWSRPMAWVLGWIFADGSVSEHKYSAELVLAITDKDVVEKVKKLLKTDAPIKVIQRNPRHKPIYSLRIYRKEIVESLKKLGVYPNKTKTMQFPEVPVTYIKDFVRGYFEGDGSIFIKEAKFSGSSGKLYKKFYVYCGSASLAFIETLQKIIRIYGFTSRLTRQKNVYCLWPHNPQRFLGWLYSYVRDNMVSKRHQELAWAARWNKITRLTPIEIEQEIIKLKKQRSEYWQKWYAKKKDKERREKINLGQIYKPKSAYR